MDSGIQDTNMTTPTSPFAPADIPDINNVPVSGAMPPMNPAPASMQDAGGYGMPTQAAAGVPSATLASAAPTVPNPAIPSADAAMVMPQMGDASMGVVSASAAPAGGVVMSDIPEPKLAVEEAPKDLTAKQPMIQSQIPKSDAQVQNGVPAASVASAPKAGMPKVEKKNTEKAAMVKPAAGRRPLGSAAKAEKKEIEKAVEKDDEKNGAPVDIAGVAVATNGLTIETLLDECVQNNASDLHLQVGLPPILRINGALQLLTTYPTLDDMTVQQLVFSTLDANQKMILIKDKEFDYSFAFGDMARFRVNAFHEKGNMAAAFRLIPNVIKTIDELGLPGVVSTFADHPNGLVLVTGPTGSGKSTTLAALVDKINTEKSEHIITIEDPIEFTHKSKRSVVAQREVHYDTYSFAAALRSILREDPDVVLIGEMRDLETIQAAITVAETGHLVFATLHTNSAAQSIDRMVDVFPAHQQPQIRAQLANILVGICSQRLVPAIDGGRIAVTEIMVTNSAVRSIIREGKTHQLDMTIQTGMSQGMQTMDRELAKYVKAGMIAYDVAREYAVDTAEFDRLSRG